MNPVHRRRVSQSVPSWYQTIHNSKTAFTHQISDTPTVRTKQSQVGPFVKFCQVRKFVFMWSARKKKSKSISACLVSKLCTFHPKQLTGGKCRISHIYSKHTAGPYDWIIATNFNYDHKMMLQQWDSSIVHTDINTGHVLDSSKHLRAEERRR